MLEDGMLPDFIDKDGNVRIHTGAISLHYSFFMIQLSYQPNCVKVGNDVRTPNGKLDELRDACKYGEITRVVILTIKN